jgi:hypothetical protein
MKPRSHPYSGILAVILCLFLAGALATGKARADDVQVSAALSDNTIDVGQSVDFTITVNGATDASVPENINVDGLTITYVGPNTQTQIMFGSGFGSGSHIQRSVVHTYSVVAQRSGQFVIPSQQVVIDGETYNTRPLELRAGGAASSGAGSSGAGGSSAGSSGGGGTAQDSDGNSQLFYAEFVLPRDSAYIGEALPIEIRLFVDARVRAQLLEMPEVTAEGCTVQKMTKPDQNQVTRNGREYVMVTYKTAVTAATAGNIKLGPVTVLAEAQLPQARPRRRTGGPFDDPMFQNPFFDDAFRMMSPPQQIKIRGEPVDLAIKPLPAEGQPKSFAGAVGNFTLTTSVKPTMVEAGDPITITAKITGRGDFDRVTAPQITNPEGWRTYPPSSSFEGDDDIGISGTKKFDTAVIAQTNKTQSPALEWSYFDPIKEQYVTLTGEPTPIKVEGAQQPAPTPVIAQQAPQAAPTPTTSDIQYIRADSSGWGKTFEPLYANRIFWEAQGAPLLALLAFVGLQVARKRAADLEARKRAEWRRQKDAELATIQRRDLPESELFQAAARALRLEAAIQTGRSPDTLDGTEVANARILDDSLAGRVRHLFDRHAEALYAGTSGGRTASSAQTRVDLLETVKGYENAKPVA